MTRSKKTFKVPPIRMGLIGDKSLELPAAGNPRAEVGGELSVRGRFLVLALIGVSLVIVYTFYLEKFSSLVS
ncbi:MAG: hypothetical protein ACE5GD_09360 [Candidatus Geothermarchaeales archaeon]